MNTREENLARLRAVYREPAPNQKFIVGEFRPTDALGVALLYYATYGEGFAIDSVYDPEELCRRVAAGELYIEVGRTEQGDIIGIHCLFRNPPGKRIMESGGWIVLPSYRNTTLAMRLVYPILGNPPSRLGLDAIVGQSVCDHLITQKMLAKYGGVSCALEIDAMPPRPEVGGIGTRISLLDGFIFSRDVPHPVYLPRCYDELLRQFYTDRGLMRDWPTDCAPAEKSISSIDFLAAASLTRMTVTTPGRDFPALLACMEEQHPTCHVRQLVVGLAQPGVSSVIDAAHQAGYFLGGVLPLWLDHDALLMQKISTSPNFSAILLHTEEAKRLRDLVVADWSIRTSR